MTGNLVATIGVARGLRFANGQTRMTSRRVWQRLCATTSRKWPSLRELVSIDAELETNDWKTTRACQRVRCCVRVRERPQPLP